MNRDMSTDRDVVEVSSQARLSCKESLCKADGDVPRVKAVEYCASSALVMVFRNTACLPLPSMQVSFRPSPAFPVFDKAAFRQAK